MSSVTTMLLKWTTSTLSTRNYIKVEDVDTSTHNRDVVQHGLELPDYQVFGTIRTSLVCFYSNGNPPIEEDTLGDLSLVIFYRISLFLYYIEAAKAEIKTNRKEKKKLILLPTSFGRRTAMTDGDIRCDDREPKRPKR